MTGPRASRWIGRVLRDKWRIDSRIARGGVGTVFAATHRKNGSQVAIKVLHSQFSRDADTRSRFLQEGYAANQVGHPGVVRILDDDVTEDGLAFLVMELLEGELLESRRVRKVGKLPQREVFEIADQLLDVLAAAHEKGIVHRDIKPDNLFITNDGRLKVLDFGFAQMKRGFRTEQTATGYLLGTPGFMSPEQAVGARDRVDHLTDIWAVGATMFNLLSGQLVHESDSAAGMLVAAANDQPRSLAAVTRGLPMKLIEIVDRAIAFDKADRWPSARSMQQALRRLPERPAAGMFESGRRSIPEWNPPASDPEPDFDSALDIDAYDEKTTVARSPAADPDARAAFQKKPAAQSERNVGRATGLGSKLEPAVTPLPLGPPVRISYPEGMVPLSGNMRALTPGTPFTPTGPLTPAGPLTPGTPFTPMGPLTPGTSFTPVRTISVPTSMAGTASDTMAIPRSSRRGRLVTLVFVAAVSMALVVTAGLVLLDGR